MPSARAVRFVLLLHIGAWPASAQLGGGGLDAADLASIQGRGSRFLAATQRLLHQESVALWPDGWALAERLGPAVAPALRAMLRQEANGLKRLLLIGAVGSACHGSNLDAWLLETATAKSKVEEQTLALMYLAAGPRRDGPGPALDALLAEERGGSVLAVGAALARVRFAGPRSAGEARAAPLGSEAVALALRGELAVETLVRACAGVDDPRTQAACDVVMRAALLGWPCRDQAALSALATDLVRKTTTPGPLRVAAALYLGRNGATLDVALVGDARARAAYTAFGPARNRLRELGVLGPVPEVLTDSRTRAVLVAGYAISAPWAAVAADVERWSRDHALATAATWGLAWRALARENDVTPDAQRILQALEPVPATFWFAWALGGKPDPGVMAGDARAARVATLALAGQIDRGTALREVEAELWRSGAHPGRVWHSAWIDLVRDALLAGSDHVSARLQLDVRPPLPRGIENSNNKFFLVADSLLRFVTERVPAPPPELRLR